MKLKPAKDILALTDDRRETYAREVFGYEQIMADMLAAATAGEGYLRVTQSIPASLRHTKAAKQLIEQLKRAEYTVEWVNTSLEERSNGKPTGGFILFEELRISWAKVRIHSGPQAMPAD